MSRLVAVWVWRTCCGTKLSATAKLLEFVGAFVKLSLAFRWSGRCLKELIQVFAWVLELSLFGTFDSLFFRSERLARFWRLAVAGQSEVSLRNAAQRQAAMVSLLRGAWLTLEGQRRTSLCTSLKLQETSLLAPSLAWLSLGLFCPLWIAAFL